MQTEKIHALYTRFSHDENFGGDSNSVTHQKELLAEYANNHGFTNYRFYVDDGYTGVNFDRPAFQQMMSDIEQGIVGTVIVKDLSRLGRNYLMVGQYTEMVFPSYNVRFIAISDNIDSDEGLNDLMPFNNLINEWYSRDISKKMRAMIQQKGTSGKRLCTRPIYGYMLDPTDPEKWVIDEYAANIVRRIYAMYLSGMGVTQIARTFTKEKIQRPSVYLHQETRYGYSIDRQYEWCETTIISFLTKPEYCGDTVNFRTKRMSYKNKKMVQNPEDEWLVFKDTHPAIIDRDTFAKAQEIYSRRYKRIVPIPETTLFSGIIYCLDCKGRTHVKRYRGRKESSIGYECANYRKRQNSCFYHHIAHSELENYVVHQLELLFDMVKHREDEFRAMVNKKLSDSSTASLREIKAEIENSNARIVEIDKYIQGLFESKMRGEIDGDVFGNLSKTYTDEKTALKKRITDLIVAESKAKETAHEVRRFYSALEKYDKFDGLTPDLLRDLVDRIEIGSCTQAEKKNGKVRKIVIYYVGIGALELT